MVHLIGALVIGGLLWLVVVEIYSDGYDAGHRDALLELDSTEPPQ